MPVDDEFRPFLLCESDLPTIPDKEGLAVHHELLFTHAEFFEPGRELEGDLVCVYPGSQLDLEFETHRHVGSAAGEILRLNKIPHAVRSARDLLEDP